MFNKTEFNNSNITSFNICILAKFASIQRYWYMLA